MKRNFLILIAGFVFATSCSTEKKQIEEQQEKQASAAEAGEKKEWSYGGETGPDHWAEFEKGDCGGKFQSPVDILQTETDSTLQPLDIHYSKSTKIHEVVNNGHSIQYNFDAGDYITLNGEKYELKQFHFHELSEHTIKGVHFPMVIHLVHVSESGKYAVFAVMAVESEINSPAFQFLDGYLPLAVDEKKGVNATFNMNDVIPQQKQYYAYTGSLTTPPCTEGVQWFIFKQPLSVSLKMINDLRELMPVNNYRNVQPLNGRVIKESL
ncbi:carbonic anhydrase family protein [Fulvivirga ulvae]|uniref:carbonic anhydrase n=1 Tax=Fulvivirga ulvae TaxID=2904245 RepID=UPI001F17B44D|nr:carbonic anhydrase family protein [Fulvivirga ulvae]UII34585.1 carbonic anhydrase family protein [Fulvivirga ulvae]